MKKPDPSKEEKKGFSWGALLGIAIAAVAVVVSVATFGLGAGIACVVAVACIGALCTESSTSLANGGQNGILDCIMNAFKGVLSGANMGPVIKSWNSIIGIAGDIWSGFEDRAEKCLDSPYNFVNWLTMGIPDAIKGTIQSNEERGEKAFATGSGYDYVNWLSMGSADMVKGAFAPEDPLSKEHWMNSFGVFSAFLGIKGAKSGMRKTGMLDDIPSRKRVNKGVTEANLGNLNGKTPATRVADKFRSLSASKRPNTVATIRTNDGKYIIGRNSGGVINGDVQKALDIVGINEFEGQCAEVNALSRAMNKGIDLDGATISVSNVRGINSTNGVHGTFKKPCSTCDPLLEYFKILVNKGDK